MPAIITTADLRKVYKIGTEKVVALDCINLEIDKGQVCCILGTSGSGKSTLLNQLAGLEKPTRGEVLIKGKNISKMSEKQLAHFRQRNIGFVFQSYNLLQGMSAIDNVAIPLTFRGMGKRKRVALAKEMLKAVGLGKRMSHKPSEMSGGQQQRVGIARAFVAKPDVVFADEPTGNLDTRTTREVMDVFLSFARQLQITIILVTHDRELARYADRIVTLVDGNIISDERNRSLYDITNDLHTELLGMLETREMGRIAERVLADVADYGHGVPVQALERLLQTQEDPAAAALELTKAFDGSPAERQLLEQLVVETGMLDDDKAAALTAQLNPTLLPPASPPRELPCPNSDALPLEPAPETLELVYDAEPAPQCPNIGVTPHDTTNQSEDNKDE